MIKRKVLTACITIFVLMALLFSVSFHGYADTDENWDIEWFSFGKDQFRTRNSVDQSSPPLAFRWKLEGLGWSVSQPIKDQKFIYHIAGGYLNRIPINLSFYDWDASFYEMLPELREKGYSFVRISNDPEVRSHPTIDPFSSPKRLYVGTGDGKVVKVDPVSMKVLQEYNAGVEIINAPTILGDDLIAFGGKDSRIYVYKGSKGKPVVFNPDGHPKAVITGTYSTVPVFDRIAFAVPVNYEGIDKAGYVGVFKVTDLGVGKEPDVDLIWYFKTDNGVAASITYDPIKHRVYFADKSGTVYALDAVNGQLVWKNTDFRSSSAATTLVNNSPALNLDNNILVIPFRYHKGRNHGVVAAFDTNTGKTLWAVTSAGAKYGSGQYDGEIANAPVIMNSKSGKSYVLFGTTTGRLRTVNLETGQPEIIALNAKTEAEQYYIDTLRGSGGSFYQGRGLATETMVGGGLVVFGANDADLPNADGTNGTLYAYSTRELPDLRAISLRVNPTRPIVGDELNLDVQVENADDYGWDKPITTRLSWKSSYSGIYTTDPFTLLAGQRAWVNGLTLPAIPPTNDSKVTVRAKINPTEKEPDNEVTYLNNVIEKTLALYCNDDFYIKSVEGGKYFKGQVVTTKVVVGRKPGGEGEASVTVRLNISGKNIPISHYQLYSDPVTLQPGEEKPVFITWNADYDAGEYTLHASINADLKYCERDFTNNFMVAGVTILEKLTPPSCKWNENKTWGITKVVCGDNGCTYYYEYLQAEIVGLEATYVKEDAEFNDPDPPLRSAGTGSRVKAGQGFTFKVKTHYYDEWAKPKYDGALRVYAEFADGTRVELEPVKPPEYDLEDGKWIMPWENTWILPTSWLALRGDEVIYDYKGDPGADWVSGGRAHYVSQYVPDGGYPFKVVVENAGKNGLRLCLEGEVVVEGSIWDDFYVRRVNPNRPFSHRDGEPTPMWDGKEDVIMDLAPWWNYETPEAPDSEWMGPSSKE